MRHRLTITATVIALLWNVAVPGVVATGTASAAPAHVAAPSQGAEALKQPAAAGQLPTRILSLSASATQMLYTIGAGSQVVGVDRYSTWPVNAPRTKFTGAETDAEDYLALRPDLIVFAYSNSKMLGQLRSLGIRALVLPPAPNMAGVYQQIKELGAVTGHVRQAQATTATMRRNISSDVASVHGAGKGDSYYIELDPTYYSATSKTFIGAEFSLFGMKDIADAASHGSAYPQITKEYVIAANPDYVFLADTVCCHATASGFAKRAGFSELRAVKEHHVVAVNDSVASEWGPQTIEEFVSLLARELEH